MKEWDEREKEESQRAIESLKNLIDQIKIVRLRIVFNQEETQEIIDKMEVDTKCAKLQLRIEAEQIRQADLLIDATTKLIKDLEK